MVIHPGLIAGVSFSAGDLTSSPGLLILGLGGLILVLWIIGIILIRGGFGKALAREGDASRAPLSELKDLLEGLHENLSKLSDAMDLFRDKSENRVGSMARSLESLPRINEGVAKVREALPNLEKAIKESGGASGGLEEKLREDLQKTIAELKAKEQENAALHKDLEGFHETMQDQALEMGRGNEKALKEKYGTLEKDRQTFEEQKASFLRHQEMIKNQIKEAGEKLRKMQEDVRRDKEEIAKLKAQDPAEGNLKEERARLEREWEMVQQQQTMLKGERDWLEAERAALTEEKKALEKAPPPAPKAGPRLAPAAGSEQAFRSSGETQEMEAGPRPQGLPRPQQRGQAPREESKQSQDLKAWGYSSLAEESAPPPVAKEEELDLQRMATPSRPLAAGNWQNILDAPRRTGSTSLRDVVPDEDLPGLPEEDPVPEAAFEPLSEEESGQESLEAPEAPPERAAASSLEDQLPPFQEREQGWSVALWNGIFILRLTHEEVKNDEAHALDEIVFAETESKDDRIVLDLSNAKYVNSRGLSSLTKIAVQRTAHLALTNDNVVKVMDMMGFLPLFTIFPTLNEALGGFEGAPQG